MASSKYDLAQLAELVADPIKLAPLLHVPDTGANFNLKAPQLEFLTSEKKYTYFVAHRRCGKCISGESYIINPETLRPTKLRDAANVKSNFVFDFNTNKIVEAKAEWFDSGKKECLRLKFFNGQAIDLTYDHLLFTRSKGWVKAEDINIGDLVLAPSDIPVFGTLNFSDDDVYKMVDESIFFNEVPGDVFLFNKNTLCRYFFYLFQDHGRLFKEESTIILHLKTTKMLKDIHHLLLRLGVWSSLDLERLKILIKDEVAIANFMFLIGIGLQPTDVKPLRQWVTVSEVIGLGEVQTYDLGMHHEDHNFVANDIIVHNSFVSSFKAIHLAMTEQNRKIYVLAPSDHQVKLFFDIINAWIDVNPVMKEFWDKHGKNNHSQGSYYKTFVTGTTIEGRITSNDKSLRGITGNYFFLDEAQEFSESVWHAIGPFLSGDEHKQEGECRSWIIGTTNNPGQFYNTLLKKDDHEWLKGKGRDYNIVYWPVDKRLEAGDISQAQFEKWLTECPTESEWNNEWLLKLGGGENSAFKYDEILNTFDEQYTYSDEEFSKLPHFIGVDWDKAQAGVNIVVAEYNPSTGKIRTVWREEFESTDYHYHRAAERIVDLTVKCNPVMLLVDGLGVGMIAKDELRRIAETRGFDITPILVPVKLNDNVESYNESLGTIQKEKIKPFLVSFLKNKMQNKLLSLPPSDHPAKTQFDAYKIEEITKTTIKYSSKHEHIIDCLSFICFGIHLLYEGPNADLNPANLELISNFQEMKVNNRPKMNELDKWVKDEEENWMTPTHELNYGARSGIFHGDSRTFF